MTALRTTGDAHEGFSVDRLIVHEADVRIYLQRRDTNRWEVSCRELDGMRNLTVAVTDDDELMRIAQQIAFAVGQRRKRVDEAEAALRQVVEHLRSAHSPEADTPSTGVAAG